MRKSRFTNRQIIGFVKQAEARMEVSEPGRQQGLSFASFICVWRAKSSGREAEDAKRPEELEAESNRLKRLLVETHTATQKIGLGVKR